MNGGRRVLVAVDTPDIGRARELVGSLGEIVGGFKIGLELFVSSGPGIVDEIRGRGREVFVDLKLHDIPNTVSGAAAVLGRLGASFLTVHALGGRAMIERAVESASAAAEAAGHCPPKVLAVTVLTSHDERDLRAIGLAEAPADAVRRLIGLAREAGAGGIVCSAREVRMARAEFPAASIVVPGIRPEHGTAVAGDDQARAASPAQAMQCGADRLVIGRPITQAADPVAAAVRIVEEIDAALAT